MLLVWLADKNSRYGIAGPMPIVMVSIIKINDASKNGIYRCKSYCDCVVNHPCDNHIVYLIIELVEVRIPYIDLRTFPQQI